MLGSEVKQERQKEDACKVVLLAVQAHPAQIGVDTFAFLLKGSRSKKLAMMRLNGSKFFGSLFYHATDVIKNFIKQCLQLGFLTTVEMSVNAYPTPVLILTETGKNLLESKATSQVTLLAVKDRGREPKATPAIKETCEAMRKHGSVENAAAQRGIATGTVYDYLAEGILLGLIGIDEVVSKELQAIIKEAMKDNPERIKAIKTKLPENISYGQIKCVVASQNSIQ